MYDLLRGCSVTEMRHRMQPGWGEELGRVGILSLGLEHWAGSRDERGMDAIGRSTDSELWVVLVEVVTAAGGDGEGGVH